MPTTVKHDLGTVKRWFKDGSELSRVYMAGSPWFGGVSGLVFQKTTPQFIAAEAPVQTSGVLEKNAGGVGENFYRTVLAWVPDLPGSVRIKATIAPGQPFIQTVYGPDGSIQYNPDGSIRRYESWDGCSKIFRIAVFVAGVNVYDQIVFSGGQIRNDTGSINVDIAFAANQMVELKVYLWGAYNRDHIDSGSASFTAIRQT